MADLDLSTLKAYTPLFPMLIKKYEQFVPDQNASVLDKINSIIAELNAIGQLSNNVVKDWNTVYQWCMNDGLQTDVNNKLEDMRTNGEISDILNNIFDNLTGDMTTLHTEAKDKLVNSINEVDDLAKLNQTNIGDLTTLTTTDKGNLVAAINNNVASLAQKAQQYVIDVKKDYSAKGDGTSDDLNAINQAITAATNLKGTNKIPTLYFPLSNGYASSGQILIPAGINVIMEAPLIYLGTTFQPFLVIGSASAVNVKVKLKLQVIRNTQSDWSNESDIGIQLYNCNGLTDVDIVSSSNFTIPVQLIGSGNGFSYNTIKVGLLENGKISLDCTNENNGWFNENLILGGRYTCYNAVNTNKNRYGIRVTSKDAVYKTNNNNNFLKPSFELNISAAGTGEAIPILAEYSLQNSFKECRNENNSATFARVSNTSSDNHFTVGYGSITVQELSTSPTSRYESRSKGLMNVGTLVFDSGFLPSKICYYDGATKVHIPKVHFGINTVTTVYNAEIATLNTDSLELGGNRGIGVFVDTTQCKRFLIKRNCLTGFGGRLGIVCYDSTGNILTNADGSYPHVNSYSDLSFTYSATDYGGAYKTGSDNDVDYYFMLASNVAKIRVLLLKGTANAKIKGFSIYSLDPKHAPVFSGYEEIVPGVNIGTVAPTAGTWSVGRKVFNAVPTVGQSKSWICTVAGTPGTWVSEGNL